MVVLKANVLARPFQTKELLPKFAVDNMKDTRIVSIVERVR